MKLHKGIFGDHDNSQEYFDYVESLPSLDTAGKKLTLPIKINETIPVEELRESAWRRLVKAPEIFKFGGILPEHILGVYISDAMYVCPPGVPFEKGYTTFSMEITLSEEGMNYYHKAILAGGENSGTGSGNDLRRS